jgi:uncharacterized membrane protein
VTLGLRTYFIAGLLVLVPLAVTIGILEWLFHLLNGFLGSYIYQELGRPIPGLGLVATVLLILLIGLVTPRGGYGSRPRTDRRNSRDPVAA